MQLEESKEGAKAVVHQGTFKHLKDMFERDIFLRSLKHVFNRILRDECGGTDLLLSSVVCHVLNCVFAPGAMVQALNNGDIKFSDDSVQTKFQFFPDDTMPSPRHHSSEPHAAKEDPESFEAVLANKIDKNDKKKKPKKKQPEVVASATTKTIGDILLTPIQAGNEPEEFKVSELFTLPLISTGLIRLYTPKGVTIRPSEIYDEIKQIAKSRFGHGLPEDPRKLKCMSTPINKVALLREVCMLVGIQLDFDTKKHLLLSNNMSEVH